MSDRVRLLVALAVPQAVGLVAGFFTASSVRGWYGTLAMPVFQPPPWVFAPVWTLLYLLMGVASWLVWREGLDRPDVRRALAAYLVQLALNFAWSFLFFRLRSPLLGLIDIGLLGAALVVTTVLFLRVSPRAGWLMLPYLAWVAFAGLLNLRILQLN